MVPQQRQYAQGRKRKKRWGLRGLQKILSEPVPFDGDGAKRLLK